jgi:hypothetical protein
MHDNNINLIYGVNMIINKLIIEFRPIHESDLRKLFDSYWYYQLKKFCVENNLININYHIITLSLDGKYFLNNMRKLKSF